MNLHTSFQVAPSDISIKCDAAIAFRILVHGTWVRDVFMSVNQDIWMGIPPNQRSILENRSEMLAAFAE